MIERPTFPMVRLRESYDAEQVDRTVDMVLEDLALPQPRIARGDIEGLRFTPVRRGGYDMTAVDDWLDEVVAELDRRTGETPPAPDTSATSAPHTPVSPQAARPDVIVDLDAPRPRQDTELVGLLVKIAVVAVVVALLYVSFA
jgi:DivIVA domain-containing protein